MGFLHKARASSTLCFCPPESTVPISPISVSWPKFTPPLHFAPGTNASLGRVLASRLERIYQLVDTVLASIFGLRITGYKQAEAQWC